MSFKPTALVVEPSGRMAEMIEKQSPQTLSVVSTTPDEAESLMHLIGNEVHAIIIDPFLKRGGGSGFDLAGILRENYGQPIVLPTDWGTQFQGISSLARERLNYHIDIVLDSDFAKNVYEVLSPKEGA